MKLPKATSQSGKTVYRDSFGGLRSERYAQDGDLISMTNLGTDRYPKIGSRPYRYRYGSVSDLRAFGGFDGLAWVDGDDLYYNLQKVATLDQGGDRMLVSDGRYTLIFPDKKCFVHETEQLLRLNAYWNGSTVTFGDGYLAGQGAQANAITVSGDLASLFSVGDAVDISGCTVHPENNGTRIIRGISATGDALYFDEGSFTLQNGSSYTETGSIYIERQVPSPNHVFVCNNRFWCTEGSVIYASKPGDPFNWNVFDGLSSDSYALEVGTPGVFTAACAFGGYPTFFKEDSISRIYGSRPSNFELVTVEALGVQSSCQASVAAVGQYLYYKSREGIMAWGGGYPSLVSRELDLGTLYGPVGGSDGRRYWVSGTDKDNHRRMFVYDTVSGQWYHQDYIRAKGFANSNGLYMLDDKGVLWLTEAKHIPLMGTVREGTFASEAIFAPIRCRTLDRKTLYRLSLRLVLEEEASTVTVTLSYDGGPEIPAGFCSGKGDHVLFCAIQPRRGDSFTLHLRGSGQWQLDSMQYTYTEGPDGP